MAKQLRSFEFGEPVGKGSHDWDKWLDGKIWQLEEGKDFNCKAATFITLARNAAKKRGMKLRTGKTEDGALVIQAIPDPEAGKGGEE